ncbi:hypothetical protein VTO42DRAFT_6162 [Malbranchea cinnamomea]
MLWAGGAFPRRGAVLSRASLLPDAGARVGSRSKSLSTMTTVLRRQLLARESLHTYVSRLRTTNRGLLNGVWDTKQNCRLPRAQLPCAAPPRVSSHVFKCAGSHVRHFATAKAKKEDGELEEASKKKRYDPVGFAKRIRTLLRNHQFDRAYDLVTAVQVRKWDCIVAWNMLLDYKLERVDAQAAFKLFNDMKKRGRKPNDQTFTIMLRGCAKSRHPKALEIAMSVYKSIFADNSPVKASTIHHNAALEVCARHRNIDALWTVIGRIPEDGYGTADNITYTIVLNALRVSTLREIAKLNPKKDAKLIKAKKVALVQEGKRIWTDVVQRWRLGQFMVDAPLVSSMGRLLLFGGRKQDLLDIFSLFRQTMDVPVSGPQQKIDPYANVMKQAKNNQGDSAKADLEFTEEDEFQGLFDQIQLSEVQKNMETRLGRSVPKLLYPLPSNAELSLIMEVCNALPQGIPVARKYWRKLTARDGQFIVDPDAASYHRYLRILRAARASAESLDIVQDEMAPRGLVKHSTFVITMSTCSRDVNNPHVLDTAGKLIDIMGKSLPTPGLKVLTKYIKIVRKVTDARLKKPDANPKRKFDLITSDLTAALIRLKPLIERVEDLTKLRVEEKASLREKARESEDVDEEEEEHDDDDDDEDKHDERERDEDDEDKSARRFDTGAAIAVVQNYHLLLQKALNPNLASWTENKARLEVLKEEDGCVREFLAKYQPVAQRNTSAE